LTVYIQKTLAEYPTKREKPTEKRIQTNEASLLPISPSGLIKGISIPLQTHDKNKGSDHPVEQHPRYLHIRNVRARAQLIAFKERETETEQQ
jgi:hypothetical protein